VSSFGPILIGKAQVDPVYRTGRCLASVL